MTKRYYKAVRPDGTSFYDPTFRWVPEDWTPADGLVMVTHPQPRFSDGAKGYLSASTVPTDCTGAGWPCCLLAVEPAPLRRVIAPNNDLPNKRASSAWVVVDKLPAHEFFGPQGVHVVSLIERFLQISREEEWSLREARDVAFNERQHALAWCAARTVINLACEESRYAALCASRHATYNAARDTMKALIARDLIPTEDYDTLTLPWRRIIGRIHPDDPEVTR